MLLWHIRFQRYHLGLDTLKPIYHLLDGSDSVESTTNNPPPPVLRSK
ncbi:hypothetical protein [Helicobacter trogontum]|nr:hypothetical protein [Helicobacter trogontum]